MYFFSFKVLTNITQMWMGPISLMLVGHLDDPVQLDGAALAISVSKYFYFYYIKQNGSTVKLYLTAKVIILSNAQEGYIVRTHINKLELSIAAYRRYVIVIRGGRGLVGQDHREHQLVQALPYRPVKISR